MPVSTTSTYHFRPGGTVPGVTVTLGSAVAVTAAQPAVTVLAYPETSPGLEVYGFGSFSALSGATVNSVTAAVTEHQSNAGQPACTFALWDGTSAQIGSTQTGTASTSTSNVSTATFTGLVTYAQLATLRVRVYGYSPVSGYTESLDGVSLVVNYTAGSGNATVTMGSALSVTTSKPVPVVNASISSIWADGFAPSGTSAGAASPAVLGTQFSVSANSPLVAVKWYSAAGAAVLPQMCGIWDIATGALVTEDTSPPWRLLNGSLATAGAGGCTAISPPPR